MPNPIQGENYLVVSGDSLSIIAGKAYGDPLKWPLIFSANQSTIKSDDPNLVFPGEIVFIPALPETSERRIRNIISQLSGKANDALTIIIDDFEIIPQSARVLRTMDTAADGWSSKIEWSPGEDKKLDEKLRPYKYNNASVFIGSDLVINGVLYGITPVVDSGGRSKILEGASNTADIIDSTMKPPYEKNNITLEDRANELVAPYGIRAIFDESSGGPFTRITASPTETIYSHLSKLATQRGFLVSSTIFGDLAFIKANTSGAIVGTIKEGDLFTAEKYQAKFDGRKRFSTYRAISQSPKNTNKIAISKDPGVSRPRFLTFQAQDTTDGNIKNAADWKRTTQLAEALTIPLPVEGWISPNGERWKENTLVSVESETLFVPDGFTFLIKRTEFITETTGKRTLLSIVPPQVYTGEPIPDIWN